MRHGLMVRLYGVLALCMLCALPALADAARWATLMEEGHEAAVVGYSNVLYGDWELALRKYKAAVREAEGLGKNDPRLAESLDTLGLLYLHLYMFETTFDCTERGAQCIKRARAVREAAFGTDNPEIARSLGNVGHYYTHLEEPTEEQDAAAAYAQALRLAEKGFGKRDPRLAEALLVLEPWYRDAAVPEGCEQPTCERALAIVEAAYGDNDVRLVPFLYQIAEAQLDMGELDSAKKSYERALAIQEGAYGKDDPRLLPSLYRYAALLQALEDENSDFFMMNEELALEEADEAAPPDAPDDGEADNEVVQEEVKAATLFTRALAILEKAYGKESVQTIPALHKLAAYRQMIGESEAAWDLYERALARAEMHYGKDDPRTLESVLALAGWAVAEDPMQAEALFPRASAIAERADAQRHIDSITQTHRAFAQYYFTDDAYAQAAIPAERLVAICERTPGIDADEASEAFTLLQQCYDGMGNAEKSATVLNRRLAYAEKQFGPTSDELLQVLRELAWQYDDPDEDGPTKPSVKVFQRIVAIEEQRANPGMELAEDLQALANAYAMSGDVPQGIATMRRAMAMMEKKQGPDAGELLSMNNQLAGWLQRQGEIVEAEQTLLKCVEIARKMGDPLEMLGPQMSLAAFYLEQKQYARAEKLYIALSAAQKARGEEGRDFNRELLECYTAQQKYADAEKLMIEQLKNPELGHMRGQWECELIQLYQDWGKAAQADTVLNAIFAQLKEKDEEQKQIAFSTLYTLNEAYQNAGKLIEQGALLQRMLPVMEKVFPDSPKIQIRTFLAMADNQLARQQTDEAAETIRRLLTWNDNSVVNHGENEFDNASLMHQIGNMYAKHDQYAQAEDYLRRYYTVIEKQHTARFLAPVQAQLAEVLTKQAKYTEAETLYLQVLKVYGDLDNEAEDAKYHRYQLGVYTFGLAKCYAAWGKVEQADTHFKSALAAMEVLGARRGDEKLPECLRGYAEFLRTQKRDEEAAKLEARLKEIEAQQERRHGPGGRRMRPPAD